MANLDLPILIVDDAKLSAAIIRKTLTAAGYDDIRCASSAKAALELIEERPASIVIADWLMPNMDGLELTRHIRQLDAYTNHFTYVILLTAKEGNRALIYAFDNEVDDFINKALMNEQLLPRIHAASRLSNLQNKLLQENQRLIYANSKLKKDHTIDPLTGLGNYSYLVKRLEEWLNHAQARGGYVYYGSIAILHFEALKKEYQRLILNQLIVGMSRRLTNLLRPIDVVGRIAANEFGIITYSPGKECCSALSFKRLYEGINLKAYKTQTGYISVETVISMGAANEKTGFPSPEALIRYTQQHLREAKESNRMVLNQWFEA